jgi:hypothetical protein
VATLSNAALAASLGLIAVIALLIMLVQKELLSAADGRKARVLSALLNVAIIPLLLGFVFIVLVKIADVLQ